MHPLALPPRLGHPLDAAQVTAKRCCACAAATGAATAATGAAAAAGASAKECLECCRIHECGLKCGGSSRI